MGKKINVFIDTSIFKKKGFSVTETMFETLRSLCQSKKVQLITTDITNNEIESNILNSVKELKTAFKRVAAENRIIEVIGGKGYKEFIDPRSTEAIVGDIKNNIDTYFKNCNAHTIDASSQSASQILNDYFLKKPPFGEGKKKHEFPDAFVLSALKNWSTKEGKQIVTISTDKDFKKFCENEIHFLYFQSLYKFLNFVLKEEDAVIAVINKLIEENQDRICKEIEKEIQNVDIYISDAEGEIFFNSIKGCTFLETSVVGLNGNQADIFCLVDLTLALDAYYWDPDSWVSVKDDGVKEIFYHHRIEGEVERTFTLEVEFKARFNAEKFRLIDIENLVVDSGTALEYLHHESDYYG